MNLDFLIALPEMVLLAGTCALMLVDLRVGGEDRRATWIMAQCVLLACALASVFVLMRSVTGAEPRGIRVRSPSSPSTATTGCSWRT